MVEVPNYMPKLSNIKVSLKLPSLGSIEGTWVPNDSEKQASWEMYVELITRVPVAQLSPDEGMLREAVSSVYSLFDTTRKILRNYGPDIAKSTEKRQITFGYIAVAVLNDLLRPFLAKWHPLLKEYEDTKPANISSVTHEKNWDKDAQLRKELVGLRASLVQYADLLAKVAGVPTLIF